MPVKKWLSVDEACAYMNMSKNHLNALAKKEGFNLSVIGSKRYFKVSELDNLLEQNQILTGCRN